jgi:hypothetical protein
MSRSLWTTRQRIFAGVVVVLASASARAQGILDVLDGETLYDGGFLLTVGFELARGEQLRRGAHRVNDPLASHELETLEQDAAGIGDVDLLAKWRFYRWDAPGKALNVSLLTELSLPTGEDDASINGMRIEPELQPGSGGVDPALGFGLTYEPERWRFNAAGLYRLHTDTDGDDARLGDELIAELAAGNRFWLEPYPGPFMRADLALRYYWQDLSRQNGRLVDTGGERATLGVNWAFRPRPSLDFQLAVEIPLWQEVHGTQLGEDWAVSFTFGYRF